MEECSSTTNNRKRKIEINDNKRERGGEAEVIPNKTIKLWEEVFATRKLPQSQYPIRRIQSWSPF